MSAFTRETIVLVLTFAAALTLILATPERWVWAAYVVVTPFAGWRYLRWRSEVGRASAGIRAVAESWMKGHAKGVEENLPTKGR